MNQPAKKPKIQANLGWELYHEYLQWRDRVGYANDGEALRDVLSQVIQGDTGFTPSPSEDDRLDKLEYQLNDHQSQLEVLSSAIADLQARVEYLENSQRKNSSVSGEALSKSRLGKLLGVSPSVISQWENGDIPSDKAAIKTQRAYETWRKEFTRDAHGKYHRKS